MSFVRNPTVEKDNQDCLVIYRAILGAFRKSEFRYLLHENLIAIFFHDLMKILTGFHLCWNELNSPYPPGQELLQFPLTEFPYFSYRDFEKGGGIVEKSYAMPLEKVRTSRLYSVAAQALHWGRISRVKVGITHGSVSPVSFLKRGIASRIVTSNRVRVPDLNAQWGVLREAIEHVYGSFKYPVSRDVIEKVIYNHIAARASNDPVPFPSCDVLVTGTLCKTSTRLAAVNAKARDVPLIALSHGYGLDRIMDEPVFAYGESAFADVYFGLGVGDRFPSSRVEYFELIGKKPRYISFQPPGFGKGYPKDDRVKKLDFKSARFMYVPDSVIYSERYGPFGTINSQLYWCWQEQLIREFPPGLIYKTHPKGHLKYRELSDDQLLRRFDPQGQVRLVIERRRFEEIYDQCDAYVFDHVGTAFYIAAATDKPIIFFDLGKRNYSERGLQMIQERCYYLEVDPADPGNFVQKIANDSTTRRRQEFFANGPSAVSLGKDIWVRELLRVIDSLQG